MNRLEQLKELYRASFSDSEAYVDYFFEKKFREDRVVALEDEGGKIVSALHLVERRLVLGGKSFRCPFVVAAATLPDYRGKGNFVKVMIRTLYLMNEAGIVLAELFPENHKYYTKYGFVNAGKLKLYKVPERKVSAGEGRCAVRKAGSADVEVLFWLYHTFVKDCDGYCDRNKADFADMLAEAECDGGRCVLVFDGENPVGYYFEYEDGGAPELVLSDFELLSEIGALAGKSVTLPVWIPHGRELPGNQARIVNVKKLLSLYPFRPEICEAVKLRIKDGVLCHNNVTLSLVIAGGTALIEECSEFDFELNVEELEMLVFGTFAFYKHSIPQKLCEIFGEKNNICFEKF